MNNNKCHFCTNQAQTFALDNNTINLCRDCGVKLYQQLSKTIVPKSPTNIFIKQKEQSTYAK